MKIGILGFGSMGKTHAYCIKNLPFFFGSSFDVQVLGVCTRNLANAENAAKAYDLGFYTDNEDDIIYNSEIDAVDICTPNIYHYETAKKAILAGKHVYCEKPLAVNYAQARELSDLARERGVKCQMVFNNRFMSPIMRAKEIINEGKVGRVLSFSVKYLHSSALDTEKKAGWKQDKDICGGGVLFDLGSHAVDLIYHLCGELESVIGKSQIAYPLRTGVGGQPWETNADEAFYMIATLKGGGVGTFEISKITTGANDDLVLEIHGDKGSIKFDLMDPNFLYFYDASAQGGNLGGYCGYTKIECVNRYPAPGGIFPGIKAPIGWLRGHLGSYYSFVDSVENNKKPMPDFESGAYVQLILERAYESARLGKELKV
ncbi:MAG: Gfo/Idh/MocA family oxidoreductase [Clostridia bacterium]|nr:Gfo/Idh/MocA family oxidoreductase [Clostridia bacterium]